MSKNNSLKVKTINPANGEILAEHDIMSKETISKIVENSKNSFLQWRKDAQKRSEFLHQFAADFRKNKERLAKTATEEMGKPIKESRSEVEKCAWVMEFYGYNGQIFLNDESVNTDANKSVIKFEPIGVVGSIMPFNFPYWQALRFASSCLIAGNTVVLKPASATLQCGIEIEKSFQRIGGPEGVFQTLVGDSSVAEKLIDSNVNGVTFTGSVEVGAKVAQRATSQLKKCVLELGGSDPFIVCEDADIEKASTGAVKGRFINCGQSCIATKRFFIARKVANEFIEKFVEKTEKIRVGDPLLDDTDMGPLASSKGLQNIDGVVKEAVNNGAEVLTGGEQARSKGYFYRPTLLKNVTSKMRVAQEETFGPVAPITIVEDELEAIRLANDSIFGLGASIWTQDLDKAERLSNFVGAGIVTINNVVVSDPRVPFGGINKSGFGRELSRYGMLEFVNIKSVRFYDQLIVNHHVE
ncbi:MAG TPA: NAD-dependent succinate-semialdehyde dehydrogenase [Nitrososphaera sp.]|jgi:succinate-semialdehyde dehydrogenase/glutarate-semialdehyde dehydrogenase/succinyl-CoA reductase|nr:NAD-dependent succinate-semialdehyde dehydrogenase [Nitrososphaera sp.]